jgi:hypothetical protein
MQRPPCQHNRTHDSELNFPISKFISFCYFVRFRRCEPQKASESSPRKRQLNNSSNQPDESPNKKFKQQALAQSPNIRTRSLLNTFSSTPQRNKHKPSFENLCKKNVNDEAGDNQAKNDSLSSSVYLCDDEKIERNLSKSWIDIMEDLDEQANELKEYVGFHLARSRFACERFLS